MRISSPFRTGAFWLSAAAGSILLFCVAATLIAAAPTALAAAPASRSYIVVLKDDVAHPANVAHRHEKNRGAKLGQIYGTAIEGYSAELAPNELKAIEQDPNVDYVEPDGVLQLDSQEPSTGFKRVYGPSNPNLDIDEIDDVRTDADVAIIDDGVASHPDLNVVSRVNCAPAGQSGCTNEMGPWPGGHGTHVAGIAAALDNSFGVVGTAPGARIWSVQVFSADGGLYMSNLIAAVNWVTEHSSQIEVVNMSFHCVESCTATALREAIAASVNKGVVYVAAAGNQGKDVDAAPQTIPAAFPDVISVSSLADSDGAPGGIGGAPSCKPTYLDDHLANDSNFGPAVDIAAPGVCIWSTVPGGGYEVHSGTSMAAPMVAGAVAGLAAAKNPNNRVEVEAIRNFIRSLGNYNWTDTRPQYGANGNVTLVGDGVQEPLLDMRVPTPPPPPGPPTAAIGTAANLTETSMMLTGAVNPHGQDGRYKFECGLVGAGYTMVVPDPEGGYFGFGYDPIGVSGSFGGLTPGASYHCRMAAWNIGNILNPVYTGDVTVTTPKYNVSYVAPGAPAPLVQDNGNIDVFNRKAGGDELDFTRALSGSWSVANLTPAGQPKMGGSSAVLRMKVGAMHAFAINKSGDIICHYRTGTEPWNYINLSSYAGATMKFDPSTKPSAVEWGPNRVGVYARAVNGDLVSLERNTDGSWFMWNESEHTTGHPTIEGSPTAVVLDPPSAYANTGLVVFARNSSYQLISFNMNTSGVWTLYNISANTGVSINAPPAALQLDPNVYAGSGLGVYAPNLMNELVEFDRGTNGAWTVYNVTKNVPGNPYILGSVAPIRLSPNLYAGSGLGVYARNSSGDLVGFDRAPSGAWSMYNVSATNGFPKIYGSPSVLTLNPNVYAGSGLQVHAINNNFELVSFDRFMDGGWHYYNETANVSGNPKVE